MDFLFSFQKRVITYSVLFGEKQMPRFVPFCEQYALECANVGQSPLEWITSSYPTEFVVDIDRVTANSWPPLIKALSSASDLTKLCVFSSSGNQHGSSMYESF